MRWSFPSRATREGNRNEVRCGTRRINAEELQSILSSSECRHCQDIWASSRNILLTRVVSEAKLNYDVPLYSQLDSVVRKKRLFVYLTPEQRTCGIFISPSRDNDKSTVSNLVFTPGYSQLKNNGDSGNGPCRLSSFLSGWRGRAMCNIHDILISWQQWFLIYFLHACSFVQFASPKYECRSRLRTLIAQKLHDTMDKIIT